MEMDLGSRLKHAWNAFLNRDAPRTLADMQADTATALTGCG